MQLRGGTISATDGNNNDKLRFGNNTVWTSHDGSLTGNYDVTIVGIILPIIWGDVSIENVKFEITIKWNTLKEDTVQSFSIYKYIQGADILIDTVLANNTPSTYEHTFTGDIGWNYIKICENKGTECLECSDYCRILLVYNEDNYLFYVTPDGRTHETQPNGFSIGITNDYKKIKKIKN